MDKDGNGVYANKAREAYQLAINNSVNRSYAYMNLSHSGVTGEIIFELFKEIAPKTCQNFTTLCLKLKRPSDG